MKPLFILDKHCDANPQMPSATPITELVETWKSSHGDYALLHQDLIRFSNKEIVSEIEAVLEQDSEIDFIVTHWTLAEFAKTNQILPPIEYFEYLKNHKNIPIVFVAYDSVAPNVTQQILDLSNSISLLVTLDAEAGDSVNRALNGNCLHLWTPQLTSLFQPWFKPFAKRDIPILFSGTALTGERLRCLPVLQAHFRDKIHHVGGRNGEMFLDYADYLDMHRRSKIVVNFAQSHAGPVQLKGRILESAYSGAAIFSNGKELVGKFFDPDTEFIPFDDVGDLIHSVEDGLANEAQLECVAKNGWKRARDFYTAKAFWDQVLGALEGGGQRADVFPGFQTGGEEAPKGFLEMDRNPSGDSLIFFGDTLSTALGKDSVPWKHFAAHGLIGNSHLALQGLSRFAGPKARFYTGVAAWIAGYEEQAQRALETVDLPEARRLLELIRKPRIDVLTQAPAGSSQYVPDFSACADSRFRIKNISADAGSGLRNSRHAPGGDAREFLGGDFNPAFYLCREIEWQALPDNLRQLGCPVFGHTEDYDIHLQAILPQYGQFDRVITCGSYEWKDLSRMLPIPVCTFPKAYGLQKSIPAIGGEKRDIDLFLSGTIFHPYHPDKAKFVNGLLDRVDGRLNLRVISRHLPNAEYFKLLGRTKISLPYVRFDGSMPTRGLESLAMGNALILQDGCSLSAFFGEEDGVFTCDYSSGELPALIERISKNWDDIAPLAERGSRRVREEFSMQKVTGEYLRFLTVLAAISPQRERPPLGPTRGKRSVISVGWTHDSDYYLGSLAAMARALGEAPTLTPEAINDFAREILLFHATSADQKIVDKIIPWGLWPVPVPEFLGKALDVLRGGVGMFPRFLALRFNLLRALHHFGGSQAEVREMAEAIASSHETDWSLGPLDDVLPYDFFPEHFNYRAYFDLAVKVLGEGRGTDPGFSRLIRASASHYASMAGSEIESARAATELDPEFPLYRIELAKRLAATKNSRREAAQILAALAGEDIVPLAAWDELQSLKLSSELPPEAAKALSQRVGRIRARIEKQTQS